MTVSERNQLSLALAAPGNWSAVTLGDLLRVFVSGHQGTERTKRNYRYRIETISSVNLVDGRSVADLRLDEITPVIAQHLHDDLRQRIKRNGERARTVGRDALKMCRAAWKWGRRPNRAMVPGELLSPFSDAEIIYEPTQVPAISSEVMRVIWEVLSEGIPGVHPQPVQFLKFTELTGLRPWDEAITLTCQQLYRSGSRWAIRLPKHKTVRLVGPTVRGLGEDSAAILLAQRDAVGNRGWLWPGLRGKGRMTRETVKRAWRRLITIVAERVEVDPALYVYCLRHGAATTALEQGAQLTEVQAMLGHSSAQTTLKHYALRAIGREIASADKLATFVVQGVGSTVEDLARVVGCESSMSSAVITVARITKQLGLVDLTQLEALMEQFPVKPGTTIGDILHAFSKPDQPAPLIPGEPGEWSIIRFKWAMERAGLKGGHDLARAINALRQSRGNNDDLDAKSCNRWLNGRVPQSQPHLGEIATVLAVSIDWLFCRVAAPDMIFTMEERAAS